MCMYNMCSLRLFWYVFVCTCVYACAYACVCVCGYVCVWVNVAYVQLVCEHRYTLRPLVTSVCVCVFVRARTHARVHNCMCAWVCARVCVYVRVFIYRVDTWHFVRMVHVTRAYEHAIDKNMLAVCTTWHYLCRYRGYTNAMCTRNCTSELSP